MTSHSLLSLGVRQEHDVVLARQRARQIAALLGFGSQDQTRIATTVSELARNSLQYAGAARVVFALAQEARSQVLTVEISDTGPGIGDLPAILAGQYESKSGMGLGLIGARRLMDSFRVESTPETGTTVVVGKNLPATATPVTSSGLERMAAELTKRAPRTALDEVQRQNQELLQTLDALERNQQELVRLNAELVDTNRGIVALYAELDEKAQELHLANKIKSRFLTHMSHEFRTPLNSVIALARLLLEDADGELADEQAKQVGYIRRAAGELLELVTDLLDLSKVEAGTMDVRIEPTSIADVFSTLRGMFMPLHANPKVDLVFSEVGHLPLLMTDKGKITQVLRNFIANALKFTEQGEVRISAWVEDDRQAVLFSVADTGVGIAAKDLELVFQEFGQVPNRLQDGTPSSGLGLAISRKLAELLGGTVKVQSDPGSGSTFSLAVPLVLESGQGARGNTLLLIDDNDVERYLLRGLLEGTSFEIIEAASGAEGLRLAESAGPAAIFVDLLMPDRSGVEVLRALRQSAATSDTPIVLVTSQELNSEEMELLVSLDAALLPKEVYSERDGAGTVKELLWKAMGKSIDVGSVRPDE
ncbi:MAG: ATP-binding protein [Trueperaceae bacterium]